MLLHLTAMTLMQFLLTANLLEVVYHAAPINHIATLLNKDGIE